MTAGDALPAAQWSVSGSGLVRKEDCLLEDLEERLPGLSLDPRLVAAMFEENEPEVTYESGERLPDSAGRVRIVVAMDGDHRAPQPPAELKELAAPPELGCLPPYRAEDPRLAVHDARIAGVAVDRIIGVGFGEQGPEASEGPILGVGRSARFAVGRKVEARDQRLGLRSFPGAQPQESGLQDASRIAMLKGTAAHEDELAGDGGVGRRADDAEPGTPGEADHGQRKLTMLLENESQLIDLAG